MPAERRSQRFVFRFIWSSRGLFGHSVEFEISLRLDPEGVRDAIEECEHRRDVDGLGNLRLGPAVVAKGLHVFGCGAIGGLGHLGDVVQERPLRRAKAGLIELSFYQRLNRFLVCSLNPQEVRMRVQSIRAAIQIGDPAGDGFLGAAGEVALRKMDRVAELHDVAQEVGPVAETFQDAGHFLAAGFGAPFVVDSCDVAGCVCVFDQLDLGFRICHGPILLDNRKL